MATIIRQFQLSTGIHITQTQHRNKIIRIDAMTPKELRRQSQS